jgi:hypothetical protein
VRFFIPAGYVNNDKYVCVRVIGREGQKMCEVLRIPRFVESRLTDGGEVVNLTRWPPFPQ